MADTLTASERAAIDAYAGPITKCPPRTFALGVDHVDPLRGRDRRLNESRARRGFPATQGDAPLSREAARRRSHTPTPAELANRFRPDPMVAERNAKIAAAAPQRTARELMEMFGVSKATLHTALKAAGVRALGSSRQVADRRARVAELAKTHTTAEIAARLGAHVSVIKTDLRVMKVKAKPAPNGKVADTSRDAEIVARVKSGATPREIGRALDISESTIRNAIKRLQRGGAL